MSRTLAVLIAVGAGVVPVATPVAQETPAAADEVAPDPLEAYLALLDDLGTTVRTSQADCDELAAAVDTWLADHTDAYGAAHEAVAADPPDLDADPALRQDVERRVGRTLDTLTDATLACAEHPDATAALERLRHLTAP